MKKKLLAAALAVALIAIMVSGTLAYFTAEDEVTNTFTIGSVEIEIYENGEETPNTVVSFQDPLLPIVNTETPSADPGYAPKVVDVKNTGLNDAYIRVHIAQPVELLGYLELETDITGWKRVFTTRVTLGTQEYIVVTYDCQTAVKPGEFTSELLKGAYLASDVDIKDDPSTASGDLVFCKPDGNGGYTFSGYVAHSKTDAGYTSNTVNVLVYAQAIQAQGFSDATTALNSGFGTNNNPWQ